MKMKLKANKLGSKLLTTGLIVAGAAAALGAGTFATFNAQTQNGGNAVAAGSLVLSNTKQGGSACLSTGGGSTDSNANTACDTLFSLSARKPGDSGSANLTVRNAGTLAASAFKIFSTACANANAAGESYNGTGSPCGKVQLTIQRWSDAGFTTPSACVYGGAVVANTCDFSDATKTLGSFQTSYSSSSAGLGLGALAAGASGYFTVGVKLPTDADNSYQGRQATIDFNWLIEQ
jgi:hypothetical protein